MAGDFTIIMPVRHRFGDSIRDPGELDHDSEAPFVGAAGEFPFVCVDVDTSQEAVLQFAHRGSNQGLTFPVPQADGGVIGVSTEHPVKVNGVQIAGGIPASPVIGLMNLWSTRLLLIPAHALRRDNVLRIESEPVFIGGGLDNFVIDNVVVFYRTLVFPHPLPVSGQLEKNLAQHVKPNKGNQQ